MDERLQAPPAILRRQLAFVMRASRALYAVAELGIADILAGGPMTGEEIGAKAGAEGPTVRRLIRALVAHGVFEELESGCFRLNAAGELLRRDVPAPNAPGCCLPPGRLLGALVGLPRMRPRRAGGGRARLRQDHLRA